MDPAWVAVIGTAVGALIGFGGSWLNERSKRKDRVAHRFEAERRAIYVRLLEATAEVERLARARELARWTKARYPELDEPIPDRPDFEKLDLIVAEIELLAPFGVYAHATILRNSLQTFVWLTDDDVREHEHEKKWQAATAEIYKLRTDFIRAGKSNLDVPTGVMTKWQERRYRLKKRLGLVKSPRKTGTPTATSDDDTGLVGTE